MLGLLITIAMIVFAFKVCGWCLGLCGKLLGGIFSLVGYLIIGVIAVTVFGFAIVAIPIIFIIGLVTVIALIVRAV